MGMRNKRAQSRPFMSPTNLCGAVPLRKSAPSRERRLLSGYVFLERSAQDANPPRTYAPHGENLF